MPMTIAATAGAGVDISTVIATQEFLGTRIALDLH